MKLKKLFLLAAVLCLAALPRAAMAETLCSAQSAEVKLDLATGTVRKAAATEMLTYSTEWDGGSAVTLAANGTTLASGLMGSGTFDWTPSGAGLITLTHTTATGSGDVVQAANFALPVAEVTKGGVTTQHTTLPAAFEAIGENGTGTVKLLADIDLGLNGVAYVPTGSDFTLDLNGKKIFQTEDRDLAPITYAWGTNGKLTINDSVGGGGITVNRASTAAAETNLNLHAVCCGGANGTLTVNGGTYAVTNNLGSAVIFYKEGNGTWTFNGGTYFAGSEGACSAQFLFCWGSSGKTLVTGGTYSIAAKDEAGIGIYVANEGTEQIEITGGDFDISTGKDWSPVFEFCNTCVVKGGTFDITSRVTGAIGFNVKSGALLIVSNGTFTVSAAKNAANCLNALGGSRIEVAGGTFNAVSGTSEGFGYVSCAAITGNQGGHIVITGAPVINQPTGGANDKFMVSVNGAWLDFTGYTPEFLGSIFVSNDGNTGFVKGDMSKCWWLSTSGGHFSTRPLEGKYWCPDGMGIFANLDESTKEEYPWIVDLISTITPQAVSDTTFKIYTNDVPVDAVSVIVRTNSPAYVVYTAADGYIFADGNMAKTNDINTSVNPATAEAPAAPVKLIKYTAPVYVDNVASNGIAYWTTNSISSGGFTVVESAAARVTWGTAGATSWYVVIDDDIQIDGGVQCKGNVHLVLCDGAKLTVTNVADYKAGIQTDADGSFTIYGTPEGAGELSATAGRWYGAGIGGNDGEDGSHITINGGTVTATSGSCGAGIGGGQWASGTDIVINGGVVYAKSIRVDGGAGIGGGYWAKGSGIVINGGVVYAEGGFGNAAIGGGSEEKGSDIAINGGKVSVFTVIAMSNAGTEGEYAYPGDFIGSGGIHPDYAAKIAAENVSIADSANVCFNLSGVYQGHPPPYKWIEEPAPSPKDFEGFVIMTPSTQRVDCVLVGGVKNWTAAKTFALTNAVTGATGEIVVNGEGVAFANKLLSLPHTDNKLMLTAKRYSMINPPTEVAHTTAKVYTNAVEDATLVETPIVVRKDAAAYVVYTADDGYIFADGTAAKTNTIDTSVNPATAETPAAPVKQFKCVAPVYVDDIAANGIDHWVTNTVPSDYTVVMEELETAEWGAPEETRWYVVTNDVKMPRGVVCSGRVNLLLCSGAKLTVTGGPGADAGIETDEDGSFTIYGEPDACGELTATGGTYGAGIGGRRECAGANITINGGKVTATGGSLDFEASSDGCGAGIGGGKEGNCANITINAGEVTARGFCGGAGIGGGYEAEDEKCHDIVINGGVVIATSGDHNRAGAGIGSGGSSDGVERITINGGTVWVHAGASADPQDSVCIGASGSRTDAASGVTISDKAKVMFDIAGAGLVEAALPEWEGFAILTPATQDVISVLVSGTDAGEGITGLSLFTLTKAEQERTKDIYINGESVPFASKMLTLTDDTDASLLKLTADELPDKTIVQDQDGNDVKIAIPDDWCATNGVLREDAVDTVNTNNNGMLTWQSYVLGLNPTNKLSGIYADTPQNKDENTVTVETKNLDETKVVNGYGLQYRLEKTEGGMETKTQDTPSFSVDVTGKDPTGHYQLSVVITMTNKLGQVTNVLDQTAEAINTVGMIKQVNAATNVIISVPWGKLAPGSDEKIAVSNVVKTANLDAGDRLRAYNKEKDVWEEWTLTADKTWNKGGKTLKVTKLGSAPSITTANNSEDQGIARGSGIWLIRKDPSKPYYLYGQANGDVSAVELDKGANLVGATGIENYHFSEHVSGVKEGDQIVVPGSDGGNPKIYTYKNGAWGYWKMEKSTRKVGKIVYETVKSVWKTDESFVEPGKGFWLYNKSGKVEVK